VCSWAEIHTAARLLQVPAERLEGAVTRRVMVRSRIMRRWGNSLDHCRLGGRLNRSWA
jgi:hypothetical protein